MKKILTVLNLALLVVSLVGCNLLGLGNSVSAPSFIDTSKTFDKSEPQDLVASWNLEGRAVTSIMFNEEELGASNYSFSETDVTLFASFLSELEYGNYELMVTTDGGSDTLIIIVTGVEVPVVSPVRQTFYTGTNDNIVVSIDLKDMELLSVQSEGKDLASSAYTITDNKLTVHNAYLKTLGNGLHKIVVTTEGGSATFEIMVTTETQTITFYGWGDAPEQANYQRLINQFMEENPNIIVSYSADNASTYMTNLRNRANDLPDVFYMPDTEFLSWADSRRLLALDSYFTQDELDDLWPESVDKYYYNRQTTLLGKDNGGSLYGLPKDLGPFTLVYNKTLLNQLMQDLTAEQKAFVTSKLNPLEPMTFQEFVDVNKLLDRNPNDNIFGVSHYEIQAAVYSNNADFFNEDQSVERITSPNFIEAMQWIADLTLVHKVMPNADQQAATNGYQRFFTGNSVFSFLGPWDLNAIWNTSSIEFDILPVPVGPAEGAKSTAWVGSMSYSISASTKAPEAAVRLAKFLSYNEAAQRRFYDLGQQVPNLVEMATTEYIHNPIFTNDGLDPHVQAGRKQMPESRFVFVDVIDGFKNAEDHIGGKSRAQYYTYDSLWYDFFEESLLNMWNGIETAEETMNRISPQFQQYLDEMLALYRP